MQKKLLRDGLLVAALALAAPTAFADASRAGGKGMSFEALDTDGDGQISRAEFQMRGQARFQRADQDDDGVLTQAELEAAAEGRAKKRARRMFKHLDSDGDGRVTQAEMQAAVAARGKFERADADNSGGLSKEEYKAAHKHRRSGG